MNLNGERKKGVNIMPYPERKIVHWPGSSCSEESKEMGRLWVVGGGWLSRSPVPSGRFQSGVFVLYYSLVTVFLEWCVGGGLCNAGMCLVMLCV